MKLETGASGRRPAWVRSADIMRPPEDLPDRIFDPRLDLGPGVYEELRKTVKREASFKGPKIFKIPRLSWMSWFDSSYRDDLQGIEQYKERQFHELERSAELAKVTVHNVIELNRSIAYFLQEFPEARPDTSQFTSEVERGRAMTAASGMEEMLILQNYLVVWLQLWPQARNELVNRYVPNGVDELVNKFIIDPRAFPRPTERIHFIAQVMLAFPEQRERLLKVADPYVKHIHGLLNTLSQGISREDFNEYHQLIGDLTIIGAKSALIDQAGIIQVEPRPLHQPTTPLPLPDRSEM